MATTDKEAEKRGYHYAWTPEARAKRLATWKAKAKLRKKPNGGEMPLDLIPDKVKRKYTRKPHTRDSALADFLAIVKVLLER